MKRQEAEESKTKKEMQEYIYDEEMVIASFQSKASEGNNTEENSIADNATVDSPPLIRNQNVSLPGAFHMRPSFAVTVETAPQDAQSSPEDEEPPVFIIHATAVEEDPTIYTASIVNMNGWVRQGRRQSQQRLVNYLIAPLILLMASTVVIVLVLTAGRQVSKELVVSPVLSPAPIPEHDLLEGSTTIYGKQASGDSFGTSIALSGDGTRIAIGSPSDGNGTAQVFQSLSNINQWIQVGDDIVGSRNGDQLGSSISMSLDGDRVVIGSPGQDDRNTGLLGVYNFQDEEGWVLQQKLRPVGDPTSSSQTQNIRMGEQVALSGNGNIIVGSYTGSVLVVEPDLDYWAASSSFSSSADSYSVVKTTIKNTTIVQTFCFIKSRWWVPLGQDLIGEKWGDEFGASLALNDKGIVLVVGAPKAGDSGKVYVYGLDLDARQWLQLGDTISGILPNSQFGFAVDLNGSGNKIVVGAYAHNVQKGLVRVYEYELGSQRWVRLGNDIIGDKVCDQIGYSVAMSMSGEEIIVGERGATKTYYWKDGDWQLRSAPVMEENEYSNSTYYSVAISTFGTTFATGAPGEKTSGLVNIYHNWKK